jgi:ATP-binding protein involved in chromosome partitioning
MTTTTTATLEAPAEEAIRNALRGVIDPELGDNIVDLGMLQRIDIDSANKVAITVALTTAGCPLRAQLMNDVKTRVGTLPGVQAVRVHFGEMTSEQKRDVMSRARWKAQENAPETTIPATCRIVAIASGKGGVGKSSVTVNLAALLAQRGLTVGVLDADIGGFSIPRMLGISGSVVARTTDTGKARFPPLERSIGPGVVKVVSMGSITGAEEDEAIMWRGLMLNRAVQHFIEDVDWGALDYLLIDMPPGTADIQMGIARMLPRTDVIIVTTPAPAAQQVAARAADMARKGHLRVAGVIENMSATIGPDGSRHAVFGEGGGERLAQQLGVALLGSIPLDPAVSAGGDLGDPAALAEPNSPAATAFALLADRIVTDTIPPVELAVCSIRQLLTAAGADLESAFDRLNQTPNPDPTPPIATTNHPNQSGSNLS